MKSNHSFFFIILSLILITTENYSQDIIKEWDFGNKYLFSNWFSSFIWEQNTIAKEGTAFWSSDFEGSACLSISGAPGVVDFWTELPFNLRWGDKIEITFITKKSLEPISGFSLIVGPAKPDGHREDLNVSVDKAGSFTAQQTIYISHLTKGTPIGIHFSVWPGSAELFVKKIRIIR